MTQNKLEYPIYFSSIRENIDIVSRNIKLLFDAKKINWNLIEQSNCSILYDTIGGINNSKFNGDKFVIWEPSSAKDVTIFYSNFRDGWYTLIYSLFRSIGAETFNFYLSDIKDKGKIGFYAYGLNYERVVRVLFDDKWQFFEKGEPLFFENVDIYKNRKIVDRMNNEVLIQYLNRLNLNIMDGQLTTTVRSFFTGHEIK